MPLQFLQGRGRRCAELELLGERFAETHGLEYLGGIPLDITVRQGGDVGVPAVAQREPGPAAQALTAISLSICVSRADGPARRELIGLWVVNLLLNVGWPRIFFQAESPLGAGIEILVLLATTLVLIARSRPWSRVGALLLVPYALWISFATVLTWTIEFTN